MSAKSGHRQLGSWQFPHDDKACQLNQSMQHHVTSESDSASHHELIRVAVRNQNLISAFVLFELLEIYEF
jgi:hypothetical protein